MNHHRTRVLFVQERLPHYRVPFFEQLRARLATTDVEVALAHGRASAAVAERGDEAELSWATEVRNRVLHARGQSLVWQPVQRLATGADLVVVEQASRLAATFGLLARQRVGGPSVAFWGHGANLAADGSTLSRLSEAAKARYSRLPHWWFAYTDGSARRVEALGFDRDRITVVQNAVDTSLIEATEVERDPARCIYVGGLYPAKRLDLVLAAADLVAAELPGFRLTVVGAGELRGYVTSAAASRPYVDVVGPAFGKDLAAELKAASVMLMPGAVGLGVLDAFAAGLPVVTAAGRGHGPELEYLRQGPPAASGTANSIVTEPDAVALARAVRQALAAAPAMRPACFATARRVSVAHMVERFTDGVLRAIDLGRP